MLLPSLDALTIDQGAHGFDQLHDFFSEKPDNLDTRQNDNKRDHDDDSKGGQGRFAFKHSKQPIIRRIEQDREDRRPR